MLRVKMFVLMPFLILLLTSDYSKGDVNMLPLVHQTLNCNERTVLQCSVSSLMPLNNVKVFWKKQEERDFECDPASRNNPPGFECNYTEATLTLTILNLTPANMGTYFCCIRTDSGHAKEKIDVSIGQCPGEFSNQMAVPGQVQCSFNGVYPKAMINWYHYDKNLTSNSTTTSLENADGTFNITSVLNTQDKHKRYNCSLWSLKHGRYSDQEIEVEDETKLGQVSGISTQLCLSWALIFLSLMFSSRACLAL